MQTLYKTRFIYQALRADNLRFQRGKTLVIQVEPVL